MPGFQSRLGILHCDDVPLDAIARDAGTPVHVYSGALIAARYRELDAAFGGYPHRLHYAIKANATLAVVGRLRELGASADANSGGEIDVALRAGFAPGDIVFTGVGKTRAELERAIVLGVRAINAESPGEVERIAALAAAQGARARIAVRINPDVDAGSHPHISTGRAVNKFGLAPDDARALIRGAARQPALEVVGLHVHIGSQVTSPGPVARAVSAVVALAGDLRADGITLEHLDVGGGLGIAYAPGQPVMATSDYASTILDVVRPTGLMLLLEPGRWIVGPAGVLVTEVVDLKRGPDDGWFVIVDGGMTDLLRPALYGAHHEIEPVAPRPGPPIVSHVVGPVCETSDTFSGGRPMPPVAVGDLLAIRDTGAYGAVMASNYNRRPMAAEVLVDADRWRVVRRRQTVDEMLQWDAEC
jgi:diaminopimelate decarboxylase